MPSLRDLTRQYWSAALIHRRGANKTHVKPVLWHVARNTQGALRTRAIAILKEIINGR